MFSEARVKSALAYWEDLGYRFKTVSHDSLREECEGGDLSPGIILITDNYDGNHDQCCGEDVHVELRGAHAELLRE